jgi:hypothetical protein
MKRLSILAGLFTLVIHSAVAQSTYLQLGQEDYPLFDRLETRSGRLTNEFFTTVKPISRRGAVSFLEEQRTEALGLGLSDIDRYNVEHGISVSGEWATNGDGAIDSRRPILKTLYKKQPDFFSVNTRDFFLSVNPVIAVQGIAESTDPDRGTDNPLFANSRGIELRGLIAKRVGFYTYFSDNQEEPPAFVNDYINRFQAVPGADYYQTPGNTGRKYDYLLARGYIDFAVVKDHINVTAGYDKHFIGDGIRSLFLSDFSSGAAFVRLTTKVWKLNYQNLYLELTPQYTRGADRVLDHKYATIHHLSVNATKWLNVGLFEGVVFSRPNAYEFSYLNPIILYRQTERSNGSPDNALLGLNFKAIAAKHFQFYGQFLLDEFKFSELSGGKGWWGNKFGVQLGAKYFDAFTVKNLDLQAEINVVRPFTYTHYDTIANYTNYNQPLAHPLGAGFAEILGIARYQPVKNLYLTLKGMYYRQGLDPSGANYGSNIFLNYGDRTPLNPADPEYGYKLTNGTKTSTMLLGLNASYELRENLFIDIGGSHRVRKYEDNMAPGQTTTYFYGGLRLNIARRDYDFY